MSIYKLTKLAKPVDFGGQVMARCPHCNHPEQVERGKSHKCQVCGMLFRVGK